MMKEESKEKEEDLKKKKKKKKSVSEFENMPTSIVKTILLSVMIAIMFNRGQMNKATFCVCNKET